MEDPVGSGMVWRLANAEKRLDAAEGRIDRVQESSKAELEKISDRIDRLVLAFLGSVLTLVVFALGIAVTVLTAGN